MHQPVSSGLNGATGVFCLFGQNVNIVGQVTSGLFLQMQLIKCERLGVSIVPSDNDLSYFKHILAGQIKKHFKEIFAKGPNHLNIKIVDEYIIIHFSGILRNTELELIGQFPDKAGIVSYYRACLFELRKSAFLQDMEAVLERNIVSCTFCNNILENSAVCLFILDMPL